MKTLTAEEFGAVIDHVAGVFGEENTEALERCDLVLEEGIRRNFDQSQTARGESWLPRKDPGPRHPLLILEGDLKVAAMYSRGQISDGKVLTRRMPDGPSGSSRAGRRRHEFGDDVVLGRPGILARPYYGVSVESADECAEILADSLLEQVIKEIS